MTASALDKFVIRKEDPDINLASGESMRTYFHPEFRPKITGILQKNDFLCTTITILFFFARTVTSTDDG